MALRNAFEEMATEGTLAELVQVLGELKRQLAGDRPMARDANDRLRVVTDTASALNAALYWGNSNTAPTWYSTGAPTALDAREVQAQQSVANFNQVRQQRWVTA